MEKSLNLKGMACPIPVLKANKEIRNLKRYDVVVCEVTDPAAPDDFKDFCKSTGYLLLSCEEVDEGWVIRVQKSH